MSIKKLFSILFTIMGLLLLLLLVNIYLLNEASKDLDQSQTQRYQSMLLANELRQSSDSLTKMVRSYAATHDAKYEHIYNTIVDIRAGKNGRPQNYDQVYWEFVINGDLKYDGSGEQVALTQLMQQAGFTDDEMALLKQAEQLSNNLIETETIAMQAVKGQAGTKARSMIQPGETLDQFALRIVNDQNYEHEKAKIMQPINQFFHLLDQRTASVITQNKAMMDRLLIFVTINVICLVICILSSYIYIKRKVSDPLASIIKSIAKDSNGNYRISELRTNVSNDIGHLSKVINDILSQMRTFVVEVNKSVANIAAASEELTATSEQSTQNSEQIAASIAEVAQGAENQLDSVRQTTKNVHETIGHMNELAAAAAQIGNQTKNTAEKSDYGKEIVGRAITQMQSIENSVGNSADVVQGLGERSKEIGQIVDTIAGIAAQTNLLALNAAIEAARAGEQGKGFAVVAEEVRKLAEQSQEATKNIAELIHSIQTDTLSAIQAMTGGAQEVEQGSKIVQEVKSTFLEIDAMITDINTHTDEAQKRLCDIVENNNLILASVQQISDVSENASSKAQSVSAATVSQAAGMDLINKASCSLAQLGQELQTSINKFQI